MKLENVRMKAAMAWRHGADNTLMRLFLLALTFATSVAQAGTEGAFLIEAKSGTQPILTVMKDSDQGSPLLPATVKAKQVVNPGSQFSYTPPDLSRPQRVLVLIVGPNSQARPPREIQDIFEGAGPRSLKSFYLAQSGGALTFENFRYVYVPQPNYTGCSLPFDEQLARYSAQTGDQAVDFDHLFLLGSFDPTKCSALAYASGTAAYASIWQATLKNKFGSYQMTTSAYNDALPLGSVVLHEFGHQLGWLHANNSNATQHSEYADVSDIMGMGFTWSLTNSRKWTLGWPAGDVQVLRPQDFASVIPMPSNKLLVVPLKRTVLKPGYLGAKVLALETEPAVYSTNGFLMRRAGIVPRIVSTGFPVVATSTIFDNSAQSTQSSFDLVLDIGMHAIPEAGVNILVEHGANREQKTIRIFDATPSLATPISILPNPVGSACYHRYLSYNNGASYDYFSQTPNAAGLQTLRDLREASFPGSNNALVSKFSGSGELLVTRMTGTYEAGFASETFALGSNNACMSNVPSLAVNQIRRSRDILIIPTFPLRNSTVIRNLS